MLNKTKQKVCGRKAKRLAEGVLNFYNLKDKEVSLVVVGDKKIRTLNKQYRGIDKVTDVLSFKHEGDINPNDNFLGEIFIDISEAKRTHKYVDIFGRKRSYLYIFYFLFVHGLLHLVGYNDGTEKDREAMIELGKKFMDKFYK